jgi:hypothetical protein
LGSKAVHCQHHAGNGAESVAGVDAADGAFIRAPQQHVGHQWQRHARDEVVGIMMNAATAWLTRLK